MVDANHIMIVVSCCEVEDDYKAEVGFQHEGKGKVFHAENIVLLMNKIREYIIYHKKEIENLLSKEDCSNGTGIKKEK